MGNDTLEGREGNDTLDGGGGVDTAMYIGDELGGVTVSLAIAGPQNTIGSGIDTLVSIENLIGTSFNDILTGNAACNVLDGNSGDDTRQGAQVSDFLFGGDGDDVLVVAAADGVVPGEVISGGNGIDTLRLTGGPLASAISANFALLNAQVTGIERVEFATSGAALVNFFTSQLAALPAATFVGSSNVDNVQFIALGPGTYSLAGTAFTFENWDNGQNLIPPVSRISFGHRITSS